MRAIAIQGQAAVLVDVGSGMGRVYDVEAGGVVRPVAPIGSIAARGYWQDLGDGDAELAKEAVSAVSAAPPGPPWPTPAP